MTFIYSNPNCQPGNLLTATIDKVIRSIRLSFTNEPAANRYRLSLIQSNPFDFQLDGGGGGERF